jgi:protein phosphatase
VATIRPGNAQHHGAREYQQDCFAFSDLDNQTFAAHGGILGVVADGMGGLAHGGEAAAAAVTTFLERYESKPPGESIANALADALDDANAAVLRLARSRGGVGNVGATLVAAVIHDGQLHWTSVGDSRIYLVRGGRLAQLTQDHIYGVDLDQRAAAGILRREDAEAHPDREALTSHLGQRRLSLVERSVEPLPLAEGDRVLLCSDGLYRALSPEEIAPHLARDPQRGCEALIDRVLQKQLRSQDNVTAVALAFGGELDPMPATRPAHRRAPAGRRLRRFASRCFRGLLRRSA